MKIWYTEKQVKRLLEEQRHMCQTEFDKRSVYQNGEWYVHCYDVKNAKEPEFPKGKKGDVYSDKQIQDIHDYYDDTIDAMFGEDDDD